MVAPPKIVTFADDVAGGSGGAGSTLSRNRTNIYSKALPPFPLSPPFGTPPQSFKQYFGAPQPSGQFAAYHQSPFGGVNVQPTSNPQPSFGPSAFGQLPAYPQDPFSGGNVQPAAYPRPAFGQPAACQQSPFGRGNVHPTTCTQNVFGFPNQQSNGTSGQASTAFFGAPQIGFGSNCSSSNWGMSGQVSATSNLSGSSSFVGGGQAFVDNQQVGSCKSPYSPTTETDITCRSSPEKLTSISAMKVYSHKSHEELRLEDYQHQRSQGTSFPATENSTNMFNHSFPFPAPLSSISESTSRSSFGNSTIASQSSIFASTSSPASGSSTVAPVSSVSASTSSSVFGSSTVAPLSSVSASTSTLASGLSTSMSDQRWTFPAQSCSSAMPAALKPYNPRLRKQPHPNGINIREPDDSCVPKGLEIIVENLGFNPWSQGKDNANKLDSPVVGGILSCVEADKDEDIIALAEFAVEQHKALHKDDCTATFTKVVVACLEPFEGGRYHIVLDTMFSGPGFMPPKRHYAVVLRKCTPRANYLTVLEKWLSS